jgi:hypothetical protein
MGAKALIVELADAVAAEIVRMPDVRCAVAARLILPRFELAEMSALHISVVPKADVLGTFTRGEVQHDFDIDVAVQKRIHPVQEEIEVEVPVLLALVDDIADHLHRRKLDAASWANWIKATNDPVYSLEELKERGLFLSLLTITYRVVTK